MNTNLKNARIGILLISIFLFLNSCNSNENTKEKKLELELKQKELELKERELNLQEKEVNKSNTDDNQRNEINTTKRNKKELRYLYHANGRLIGYFDDGTIVGCPRCDFMRINILALFKEKVMGTYEVQNDGSLLINNSEREFPNYNDDNGWALIDFKWYEKVPQY